MKEWILILPDDEAVGIMRPLVRCKDCKHSDLFKADETETTMPMKCLGIRYGGVYPDWYCEHGDRRSE